MKKAFILSLALLTSACVSEGLWPSPFYMKQFPPPGPPNYQKGMIQGCKTALGAHGHTLWGMFHHGFHYDVDKALNDRVYYQAWKDAYYYCKYEFDKSSE